MALRTEAMPDNANRIAVFYGPTLLAADLGSENDPAADKAGYVPVILADGHPISEWVKPVSIQQQVFKTDGVGRPRDFRLVPFYEIHDRRYTVYLDEFTPENWTKRESEIRTAEQWQKELEARTLDVFQPGEMQPERAHNVQGEKSDPVEALGRKLRHAYDGGWFSFEMKVDPAATNELVCTWWGDESGERDFDILIDGATIASQRLLHNQPGKFWDAAYPIPPELTRGKSKITVKLQAQPGNFAGGLFFARILRAQSNLKSQAEFPPVSKPAFWRWAQRPPMGWNSYDTYGDTVTEAEVLANATSMKDKLVAHGWQYVVVDFRWYDPEPTGNDTLLYKTRSGAKLSADDFGRLTPAANRFPSAAGGKGFKALADQLHSMGLKLGVHVMRGIPRQAVLAATPIENSRFTAAEAGNTNNVCGWCPDMFGVRTNAAGQDWYDSLFRLYAVWGVDFVKVDDLSQPYHVDEIEMIRRAIDKCGRQIVFSTSPGPTPVEQGDSISTNANMWRVSGDFWDKWSKLKEQFSLLSRWQRFSGAGHRADADMIPLGRIAIRSKMGGTDHYTHFNPEERRTLITLWNIAASPLMLGMSLPDNDAFTLALLTNDEVLSVDQTGRNSRQIFNHDGLIAWSSDVPDSPDKYVALFNTREAQAGTNAAPVTLRVAELGFTNTIRIRDLWAQKSLGEFNGEFAPAIPAHGSALFRITPMQN